MNSTSLTPSKDNTNANQRRQFEAWSKITLERDEHGEYIHIHDRLAWGAWQASAQCSAQPCEHCNDSGSIHGTDCGACCPEQPIGFVSEDTLERLPLEGIGRIDHKPWDEMGRNIPVYTRPLPSSSKPEVPAGPDHCPITGLAFYGNMEHPKRGVIAMYGGPFDVYSLPELQKNDGELRRERFDLDADDWVEGGEPLGYFYHEQQPESD